MNIAMRTPVPFLKGLESGSRRGRYVCSPKVRRVMPLDKPSDNATKRSEIPTNNQRTSHRGGQHAPDLLPNIFLGGQHAPDFWYIGGAILRIPIISTRFYRGSIVRIGGQYKSELGGQYGRIIHRLMTNHFTRYCFYTLLASVFFLIYFSSHVLWIQTIHLNQFWSLNPIRVIRD